MTTNAKGDGSLTPDPASDTPIRAVDEDWEGLKRVRSESTKPERGGKLSVDEGFSVLGVILFIICWIVFGVIIFHVLMGMGIFVVFSALGGLIGGFIAAVIVFIMGMAGISF